MKIPRFARDDNSLGNRRGIRNDRPIIPDYEVNDQGSGDMYPKGGEMLHTLSYRWANVVPGFDMPIRVTLDWPTWALIKPTEAWQTATVHLANPTDFRVDENFYVVPKLAEGRP